MNEWILAGIVIVGSILALGAGSWVMSAINRKPTKKDDTQA